ncbi:30S ribosomal protein S27ae [Nanobdella aerobiophila]|uniref:Small ribosomal subunit protein eS31 n=1 Tax=Nanobdella aerobiophila TaxID=2586965 RepID=A0A915WR82_9ARCH|nr:30S ribosomal protein S27ae [Nanobdella aerobiophila]BBL45273.1 30S ribosomal protein S27ae [Nanobdella aerobiophila]
MSEKELSVMKLYRLESGRVERIKKICPKCGRFMADHKDRYTCGYCSYTEFKENKDQKILDGIGIKI